MIRTNILLINGIIISFAVFTIFGQDIGFPEQEKHKHKVNAHGKKPIFIPGRCSENEFLYPGDQKDDWVCDCRPGYIYYPSTDFCYLAYQRGPCRENEYLILVDGMPIPQCKRNLCKDGELYVMKKCYKFGTQGPCKYPELSEVLGINATSLRPACIKESDAPQLTDRFSSDELSSTTTTTTTTTTTPAPTSTILITPEVPLCAEGTKRFINGTCPEDIDPNQTRSGGVYFRARG